MATTSPLTIAARRTTRCSAAMPSNPNPLSRYVKCFPIGVWIDLVSLYLNSPSIIMALLITTMRIQHPWWTPTTMTWTPAIRSRMKWPARCVVPQCVRSPRRRPQTISRISHRPAIMPAWRPTAKRRPIRCPSAARQRCRVASAMPPPIMGHPCNSCHRQ